MTISISTKPHAKTIVSALRRELKALDTGTASLSHNDCLALMAKALGFPSWNAWEATLEDANAVAVEATPVVSKYPLNNADGKFDFVSKDVEGQAFTSGFTKLDGTRERLYGTCLASVVTRQSTSQNLLIQFEGRTDVDYESQQTMKTKNGFHIWTDDDGEQYSEAWLVIAPEDCDSIEDAEDLPIRQPLISAFLEYFKENGVTGIARVGAFGEAEGIIGFSLTSDETDELYEQLTKLGLI